MKKHNSSCWFANGKYVTEDAEAMLFSGQEASVVAHLAPPKSWFDLVNVMVSIGAIIEYLLPVGMWTSECFLILDIWYACGAFSILQVLPSVVFMIFNSLHRHTHIIYWIYACIYIYISIMLIWYLDGWTMPTLEDFQIMISHGSVGPNHAVLTGCGSN